MSDLTKLRTVSAQQTARKALRLGFPITCATCEHLKRAFDTDADDCGKALTCGGPIFGRSYPDYEGPFKPDDYEKFCLRCGSDRVDYHAYGGVRRFGLCFGHRGVFNGVAGPGVRRPVVTRVPGRSS
jgi:hypothetical protein